MKNVKIFRRLVEALDHLYLPLLCVKSGLYTPGDTVELLAKVDACRELFDVLEEARILLKSPPKRKRARVEENTSKAGGDDYRAAMYDAWKKKEDEKK